MGGYRFSGDFLEQLSVKVTVWRKRMGVNMASGTKESSRHIDVVLKALDILDCFQQEPILSIRNLIDRTKMTRSRIMRLTGTLLARGYLYQEPETRHYRLGSGLLTLGKMFELSNTLISLGRPILKRLAQKTGESTCLYVIDRLDRFTLACEKGTQEIRFSVTEGERKELYAGAAGKTLLAFAPPDVKAKILKKIIFKQLTPNTIVDAKTMRNELDVIYRQGYALSRGERIPEAFGVAVPVFNHEQKCCAVIGIAGPISRFSSEVKDGILKVALAAARDLSKQLGYSDNRRLHVENIS